MTIPTQSQVLEAFDALGGTSNQSMTLAKHLELKGFASDHVVTAINTAMARKVLVMDDLGGIRKGDATKPVFGKAVDVGEVKHIPAHKITPHDFIVTQGIDDRAYAWPIRSISKGSVSTITIQYGPPDHATIVLNPTDGVDVLKRH